jgi:chromosome partitioning protein
MSILTIASSKGGPGKTTVAMLIALSLANRKTPCFLIDADPTKALSQWAEHICETPLSCVYETDENKLLDLADEHSGNAVVIIDTAGFNNMTASVAMTIADHVLIPVSVGAADVDQADYTARQINTLSRSTRRQIDARLLLNKQTRSRVAAHVVEEVGKLAVSPLTTTLGQRAAYPEVSFTGILPSSGTARDEITALIAELDSLGWLAVQAQENS